MDTAPTAELQELFIALDSSVDADLARLRVFRRRKTRDDGIGDVAIRIMTLVAIARKDGFETFTHPQRVKG